jgi:hypothetical protein
MKRSSTTMLMLLITCTDLEFVMSLALDESYLRRVIDLRRVILDQDQIVLCGRKDRYR